MASSNFYKPKPNLGHIPPQNSSPGLYFLALTMPVSTTNFMPAMVMEVSAMLVERITLRQPWKENQTQAKATSEQLQHRNSAAFGLCGPSPAPYCEHRLCLLCQLSENKVIFSFYSVSITFFCICNKTHHQNSCSQYIFQQFWFHFWNNICVLIYLLSR